MYKVTVINVSRETKRYFNKDMKWIQNFLSNNSNIEFIRIELMEFDFNLTFKKDCVRLNIEGA